MDLRIKRTRSNIINAFLQLRARKPVEKITVKELAELAFINKATFYSHYKDIYDLSEQLEEEAVNKMISDIPHPEYILSKPKEGVLEIANSIMMQGQLFDTLFDGTRQTNMLRLLEIKIKAIVMAELSEKENTLEAELLLSFLIQGSFYAFQTHRDRDFNEVIDILGNINLCTLQGMTKT